MVAMTIGLLVLAGVAQVFATGRTTYRYTDGLSRIQENGRFGMHFLTSDVRMAGYMGCLPKSATITNHLNNPTDYATDLVLGQHINGHAYIGAGDTLADWSPALPADYFADGEVLPDTDVLIVRRASDRSHHVLPPYMPTASAALHLEPDNGLRVNDIVIVADCQSADLFQITGPDNPGLTGTLNHNTDAVSQGPGSATKNLSKTYQGDAEILRLTTNVYYIGTGASGGSALFVKALDRGMLESRELLDGIDTMQVLYGEDDDGDSIANIYRKANQVTDWSKVVSVRTGLLARTPDNADTQIDTQTYVVAGTDIAPFNDYRHRRVFTSTIEIRN